MASERHLHQLTGCTPIPLAHYLKALGILRIVAEQVDPTAQGWWAGDVFQLCTTLDRKELLEFFLNKYHPTPLVGPWGARSGFFSSASEKSAREALDLIVASSAERLAPFREAIACVQDVLRVLKLADKAETPEDKRRLMMQCRASFPDSLLPWLDATYMLLDIETKYPPLLGTGGNEGSGSYMSGFAQQVVSVIVERSWDHALPTSLFGTTDLNQGSTQTPGHFSPEAAGGPNAASSSEGGVAMNPWGYLLMLEGTLLFAAAAVKRMEHREGGTLGYPFCVRQTGVGYASAAATDELNSRAEMWLPLWSKASTTGELSALFAEGRAQVGQRTARNGVDFARAIAGLGTDRGIDEFQRYAFQQRNGLSYFAIPLSRFKTEHNPQVNLLAEPRLDRWLDSFRRAASASEAPSRAQRALRQLDTAIFDLCQSKGRTRLQAVVIALGEAEAVLAISRKWREDAFQRPVPLLSSQWLTDTFDHTPEFRLAVSLAGMFSASVGDFRQHLEPIIVKGRSGVGQTRWVEWNEDSDSQYRLVWQVGSLESNLIAVVNRRVIDAVRCNSMADDHKTLVFPADAYPYARLDDVAAFLAGVTDDQRLSALLRGLILLDWPDIRSKREWDDSADERESIRPSAGYALAKLCHSPYSVPRPLPRQPSSRAALDNLISIHIHESFIPLEPKISRLLAAGRLEDATPLAARRLRGSSLPAAVEMLPRNPAMARRIAAALLFPLAHHDIALLAESVLKPLPTTV